MLSQRRARRREAEATGRILARLHWQCWRADPPPAEVTDAEFIRAMPLVIQSGSVGLVWPRLRGRFDPHGAVALAMEAAYDAQVAHNAEVEREVVRVMARLRDAGVESVLIKGLAVAGLYPAGLIRPAGDIDLVVRDEDYDAAKGALMDVRLSLHRDYGPKSIRPAVDPDAHIDVDLHRFSSWKEIASHEFFDRAQCVRMGKINVTVPDLGDHLRALCLHFLRHAAARPLRLVDIALLVERCSVEPNWQRMLCGYRSEARQVIATLGLARELLGVDLESAPPSVRGFATPDWFIASALWHWVRPPITPPTVLNEMLSNPLRTPLIFARRWPDPVRATIGTRAPFNRMPRLPVQAASYLLQTVYFAAVVFRRQVRDRID